VFDRLRQVLDDAGHRSRIYAGHHVPGTPTTTRDERVHRDLMEDVDRGLVSGIATLATSSQWSPPFGLAWVSEHPGAAFAVTSDDDLVRQGARYLIARGCRKLALVAWLPGCEPGQPSGPTVGIFRHEIERSGLQYCPEWVRADLHPSAAGAGWAEFREIWTSYKRSKPDGLLIADDQFAARHHPSDHRTGHPGARGIARYRAHEQRLADDQAPI
jgi:DNA-binding LacI/PurR family transcriptional regulator